LSFKPYVIYVPRLSRLKPGHFIRIGDKFYQVQVARFNREPVALAGGVGGLSNYALTVATNENYVSLVGEVDVGRVIQHQYLACGTVSDITLYWGKDPLWSKWRKLVLNNVLAPLDGPMELDRWSYAKEMFLALDLAAGLSQTLYFDKMEYEVAAYEGTPIKYLHVMPSGQAAFVERISR